MGIDLTNLDYQQFKELAHIWQQESGDSAWTTNAGHPYQVGKIYLIRTVTMIQTGRLVRVTPQELVLEDAAWIADTGRFADALAKCEFDEVEPFPDGQVIVGRGAIVDAVQIASVQRVQK
jgi:hypothetical protein